MCENGAMSKRERGGEKERANIGNTCIFKGSALTYNNYYTSEFSHSQAAFRFD
jgi:hypothetical protein